MSMSHILVIGATGRVGREVVNELIAAGLPVRALARRPEEANRAAGVEVVAGEGKLVGPTEVSVGDRRLRAKDVILATGSRPKSLPGLDVDGETVVTSDHITQWTELPGYAAIAGAGAVGAALRDAGFANDMASVSLQPGDGQIISIAIRLRPNARLQPPGQP